MNALNEVLNCTQRTVLAEMLLKDDWPK